MKKLLANSDRSTPLLHFFQSSSIWPAAFTQMNWKVFTTASHFIHQYIYLSQDDNCLLLKLTHLKKLTRPITFKRIQLVFSFPWYFIWIFTLRQQRNKITTTNNPRSGKIKKLQLSLVHISSSSFSLSRQFIFLKKQAWLVVPGLCFPLCSVCSTCCEPAG